MCISSVCNECHKNRQLRFKIELPLKKVSLKSRLLSEYATNTTLLLEYLKSTWLTNLKTTFSESCFTTSLTDLFKNFYFFILLLFKVA